MPGPEVWKLYIWSRVSLIWKWCFMEKTVTDEESASPLYYKMQLSVRLVLPSTIPLPSWLRCLGFSCQLASLSMLSPFLIVLSSAWDQLVPAHRPLPSLDQHPSCPRSPPCRIPGCSALWHCQWRHPGCVFHSQNCIYALDCHFWDGNIAKETGPYPCSHPIPCGDISYQVLLFNFLWL